MSFLHLTRTRTSERSPSPSHFRPLRRTPTKHARIITLSDDEDQDQDDYPYSSTHRPVRPSRALTLRPTQPTTLERYNVWSERRASDELARSGEGSYELDREMERERTRLVRHSGSRRRDCDDEDDSHVDDDEERAFRLKIRATLRRPHSPLPQQHHHHHHHVNSHRHHLLPSVEFRRKDKWVGEEFETRERSRSRSRERAVHREGFWGHGGFWGESGCERESGDEKDSWSRYRRIKRTKTEEWRPLSGWRRI